MHIALFSPGWPLGDFHNGIVTYVHWMQREFVRQGHRVSIFSNSGSTIDNGASVHLIRPGRLSTALWRLRRPELPENYILDWGRAIAASMLKVHRNEPIDIIEMEESFGWSADVERRTRIPVVVRLHGPAFLSLVDDEVARPLGLARIAREGDAMRRASAVVSPSAKTLEQTLAHYRLSPSIRAHIVNPVPIDPMLPVWSLDSCDRNALLFIGRFDRRKGADVVLRAFERLSEKRPALRLIFVGPDTGLWQSDGSRVQFDDFCRTLLSADTRARIDFRGPLEHTVISELRARAMLTVVGSRWENQGYALLEAMSQGCPIVASDVGGNPECIVPGKTGFLARSEDPEDFAVQIDKLIENTALAVEIGAGARQFVTENHSTKRVVEQSVELYGRAIARRSF